MDVTAAADLLREQAVHVKGRSPLYRRLLAGLAGAVERGFDGGVVPRLLETPGPSSPQETRLLILAALHHAALEDPGLPHAAWFPTATSDPRPPDEGAPAALALAHLVENEEQVRDFIATHRLQTNEIGRCTALLPGLLVAGRFDLPLRLVEVGCSAGLNLRFDRYHYRYLGGPSWGPSGGPLLEAAADGSVPDSLVPPTLSVLDRRGVDLHPVDGTSTEGARLLTAFVWPDEDGRHERLRAALDVARATPATLERANLVDWVQDRLDGEEGRATVVFHSLVTYLLDPSEHDRFEAAVDAALRRASPSAPVVHVALEPPRAGHGGSHRDPGTAGYPELRVRVGAGDGPPRPDVLLTSDWHGRWVRWW